MKEVSINNKTFQIKELLYKDVIGIGKVEPDVMAKKILQLATTITDEEYDKLTMKEGIELQKAVNDINDLQDFQSALKR